MKYWMSPVSDEDGRSGVDVVRAMLDHTPPYFCWGANTHGTARPGDRLCIHVTKRGDVGGVVANGAVTSTAMELVMVGVLRDMTRLTDDIRPLAVLVDMLKSDRHVTKYQRVFTLDADPKKLRCYYNDPVVIDDDFFLSLHVYQQGRVANRGLLASATLDLDVHDFDLLTRAGR
jgi:hypothetical protein